MMSKKDFEALAEIIAAYKTYHSENLRRYIAKDIASYLATTNPRFDRERFLKACK